MSEIWKDPGQIPRAKFHGEMDLCLPYMKEARRVMMKHMTDMNTNQLGIKVGESSKRYPDGTVITARNRGDLLQLDIYPPGEVVKKPKQAYFQCDLYEDDPDFPEDITKQTKRSIYFSVHEIVDYDVIDERHGNYEWNGEYGLITWDGGQSWGRAISNKKSYNDGIIGSDGDIGCNYNRPEHPKRSGEITIIHSDYTPKCDTLLERGQWTIDMELVFEPDNLQVHKQTIFIKNVKYTLQFGYDEIKVMGACAHTTEEGISWCVVVTQPFRPTPGSIGLPFTYEDVWYFPLDADDNGVIDVNPIPIKIHTQYLTLPEQHLYESSKSDITPWQFTKDGTQGCALRHEQYHVSSPLTYGVYSDPRFIFFDFVYTREGVTCTGRELTGTTDLARTVVDGGASIPFYSEEKEEWFAKLAAFDTSIITWLKFPIDRKHGPIDMEYKTEEDVYGFGGSNIVTTTVISKLPNLTDVRKMSYDMSVCNGDSIIWTGGYEGTITDVYEPGVEEGVFHIRTRTLVADNPIGMMYVGGSPYHNIGFFVRIEILGRLRQYITFTDFAPTTCQASGYTVKVQLLCIFKGEEVEVGDAITHVIPSTYDSDGGNSAYVDFPLADGVESADVTEGNEFTFQYNYYGLMSHYMVSTIQGSSYFRHTAALRSGHIGPGDFGGSIRYADDGSHCVISCSYMDIVKYVFPWHKYQADLGHTYNINRYDTMDKWGVDPELQGAWEKYMINYAIIGESEEDESGDDGIESGLVGISLGGDSGSSGSFDTVGGTGDDEPVIVEVKQLSNLLFGKVVETEPDENGDYEFGIKDKDTNVFLPIGLYAGDVENV